MFAKSLGTILAWGQHHPAFERNENFTYWFHLISKVEDGLKALKAQLVAIREILEHATWGTTSGLHCQKTPEEPICKALKELDDLADEKQKRLDGEKKIVDDEITRIKTTG